MPKAAPEAAKPPAEAKPAATAAPEVPATGIKNDVSAVDRQRLGLPERDTPEGRTFDEMYDAGKAKASVDPLAASRLLDDLRANPERVVSSDTEAGLLLKHKVDLENGLQELTKRADDAHAAGDANGELIARAQLASHRAAIADFTGLMERSGTAAGRALVARKMMSAMDYSLSHMESEAQAAKGAPLNPVEQRRIQTLFQEITDASAAAEKAKAAYKTRLQRQIDDVSARLESKDYTPAPKRAKPAYDAETLHLQSELEGLKRQWETNLRALERAQRTPGQRAADVVKAVPGFTKSLKASLDDSAVFRQGWRVMFTNPVIWGTNALRTFSDAWKTFKGKEVMDEVRAEIKLNPYYEQAKQAKLAIGAAEEEFPTSLPEKVPVLGKVYKAAENAFTAFQYRNRMHVFAKLMEIAQKSGVDITDAGQLRSVGKLVNSLTARGHLGKLEPVAGVVNNAFFSARKIKADWDFLTAHSADRDMSSFARKQAFQNLAKVIGGTAAILLIAHSIDPDSVDFDPRSANFGKIKVGNTRYDVTGGVAPMVTLAVRLAMGSTKNSTTGKIHDLNAVNDKTGKLKFGASTYASISEDFFRNKLSPFASVVWNRMRGQTFSGEKPTLASDARDLLVPMAITNFVDLMNDTGATPASVATGVGADFFGIGVSNYSAKKP